MRATVWRWPITDLRERLQSTRYRLSRLEQPTFAESVKRHRPVVVLPESWAAFSDAALREEARSQERNIPGYQGGREFSREMVLESGFDNIITVTATANGIVIGGMSYQVDPNMKRSNVDNRVPTGSRACDIASELLKCVKSEKATKVRIRKISVDIDFDDDECR